MSTQPSHPVPLSSSVTEPAVVQIPEGWFLMGSENRQDNEKPVHRVWLDAFGLAARQVTNTEYRQYLSSTGSAPPPFWNDPNFNDPEQPVVACPGLKP